MSLLGFLRDIALQKEVSLGPLCGHVGRTCVFLGIRTSELRVRLGLLVT
jgi:hypothetical protein